MQQYLAFAFDQQFGQMPFSETGQPQVIDMNL